MLFWASSEASLPCHLICTRIGKCLLWPLSDTDDSDLLNFVSVVMLISLPLLSSLKDDTSTNSL